MKMAVEGQIPIGMTVEPGLLFPAIKVRDVTAGYPGTLVGSPIPMVEYDTGSYGALFAGEAGKLYAIKKGVFTDGTYATLDTNYPSGDDQVQVISKPVSETQLASVVVGDIQAVVEDDDEVQAVVEDCD